MRVTVFGANGQTGHLLVRQALHRGDQVTAVVRDPNRLSTHDPALTLVTIPDLADSAAVAHAVEGADAMLRPVYADLRAMESDLAASDTAWTAFRPPKLTNGSLTSRYRTAVGSSVPRGYSLSRDDLAHAMLAAIDDPETLRATVGIAY